MNVQQANEVRNASEVLVTLPAPMPDALLRCLAERPGAPGQVQVLCRQFQDPAYLLSLLRLGFQVFDADMPEEMLLILDRRVGYRLPNWHPISAPFDLACRLLWGRGAVYTRLAGVVASVEAGQDPLFQLIMLAGRQHIRIVWHSSQQPKVGDSIVVLGVQRFMLGASLPILLEAISLWPGEGLS